MSRDLTWVNGEIEDVLTSKASSVVIFAERENEVTKRLRAKGIQVYYYGKLGFEPKTRFTVIRYNRDNPQVAIANTLETVRKKGKFKHTIYETRDQGQRQDKWINSLAIDLISLCKLASKQAEQEADASMTFEELRIAKSDDFPELAEGKRVSWSVEYGKVTKQIADPKGKTIQSVKEEIERSKEFLEGLKKAKDKNPDCLVKPRVTAQSKGIAAYKGVFSSVEDAQASNKTICLIPSADGKVYEMRKTDMGDFIAPKDNIVDFQAVRAGFTPALPLVPHSLLRQIISFFRCFMEEKQEFEALAHILWDKELEEFTVYIPPQQVSKARVEASLPQGSFPEDRFIHYADIHSHNSMEAKFSTIDNADERATRIYAVVGRLDKFFPDLTVRMSCGGNFLELDPSLIFEDMRTEFPQEWRKNVHRVERDHKCCASDFWHEAKYSDGKDDMA